MKAIEDLIYAGLELIGLETGKFSLGDLFPIALIALFPAALLGAAVSDWKYKYKTMRLAKLPWDWLAALFAFIATMYFSVLLL